MYTDCALLLNTVLSESGCTDASLQDTAETVPLVYRTLAEHSYCLLYAVSVAKALLHEDDAAFAHLARAQAQRQKTAAETLSTPAPPVPFAFPSPIPPLAPSDSLDMHLTIIGGGTCCELMLRLICGHGCAGGGRGAGIFCGTTTRDPLVHPSHITVITRQPERLARYADLGVHCLARHHGRQAVERSDVVVLTCPPAQLQEVARDLFTSASMETATSAGPSQNKVAATASSPSLPSSGAATPLLRSNAVLLFCMAGVPVRKVAQAFQHSSLDLIFTPSLHTLSTHFPCAAPSNDGDEPSTTACCSVYSPTKGPPLPAQIPKTSQECDKSLEEHSIEEAGQCFTAAMAAYRSARLFEMHSSTSFLRPAVLQQAAKSAATGAAAAREATCSRVPPLPGGTSYPAAAAPPRLTDFTAGRHPSTCPTLAEYLDLWRVVKAYVKATFAEEALKLARARGSAGGGSRRRRGNVGTGDSYGGLVSVVLPDTTSKRHCKSEPGEVEAELLPALILLPAAQTKVLWDAWWGNSGRGGLLSRSDAAPPLPPSVTDVTGMWLCRVYTSAASLKASLDDQFRHLLGACTR
ncbi:NADP oxidoreductase coenzyme F420-dependent family protein [Leishmania donovani]|uniref:NADP oxidoreductase coenzyme F420-dependent family protein n=1 Tax=Leishmania donovani TaxID=5661 RepID=A0A504XZS8_LEIDO|nr:NADP oxidoreductase coenzyme F420-dependent family protein [Leishmania donovani]